MNSQERSGFVSKSASTVLPSAEVIRLPLPKRADAENRAFTKPRISRMRCPPGQSETFFWDASCRGFGIRALSSGRRSWIYQYRDEHKRTRRIALGDLSAVSLDAARDAARRYAASVTQGANPSADRKATRAAPSVLHIIEAYLHHAKARQRPRSYLETERHLRHHAAPIHHDRVESVRRRDIAALLERVSESSGPVAANRLRAALSALWSWGLRIGLIDSDHNPVTLTLRHPEKARERTLSDAELKAIWKATEGGGHYSCIIRLCLLTGCRRDEIGGLGWDEIRDDRIVISAERMKGGITHEIALLPMITAALPSKPENPAGCVFGRRGSGFSGWSKSKSVLDTKLAEIAMPPWGLHDLRRTFSTRLHDAGVEPIVIEALLAHKQQGVAAIYNRASFREAKRSALVRWHEILRSVLEQTHENEIA